MLKEELFVGLKEIIKKMNQEVDMVIVEGKKDEGALKALGFKGRIFVYAKREPEILEGAVRNCESVVVLTDFDSAGKDLCNEIMDHLLGHVKINKRLRREFGRLLTSHGRRGIESINRLVKLCKRI
jgi:5S rRNA maturation endonuclease (ribonuclease M5)